MILWMIDRDQNRRRLIDRSFRPCFYVYGPERRLTRLAQALVARAPVTCALTERTNIWDGAALRVLEVAVHHPTQFAVLVRFVHRYDSTLTLFNSDLMLAPLYCWQKRVFPLAKVDVEAGKCAGPFPQAGLGVRDSGFVKEKFFVAHHETRIPNSEVFALACRDDEWATDFELPPLKILRVRLEGLANVDPQHGRRGALEIEIDGEWRVLDDTEEPVVSGFARLLRRHDPDLILSEWGDSTLFPGLLRAAQAAGIKLPLNRDNVPIERSRPRSYMSYGRILFKESATTLFGRLHVDTQNSFIADQCDLEGLWELVRVTRLPVQYCARTTTGTGISYMQMELAYRDGVLIPEQKAEPESPKHPDELLRADRGGLVFPPRLGFFENVGELDFVSEYPSIMARFNISPETVNCACCPEAPRVPELGYRICQRRRGITSRVVERLIVKRQEYKRKMSEEPVAPVSSPAVNDAAATAGLKPHPSDAEVGEPSGFPRERDALPYPFVAAARAIHEWPLPQDRRHAYKQRRSALKWLLVTCFGYTGYKNARFGKIEAHEAINALAREKLLVAKETVEERGFHVLHALVDSLYVQKEDATREEYETLARDIERLTGLPMALEAVYRYVVFLPSKQSSEVPVPNRFFCVSEEGALKIRGLECRKHDTPPLVARMQQEALRILAEARDPRSYCLKLEEAREVLARYLARLEAGSVPLEDLVISRRLTRAPEQYKHASATAIAARQLDRAGVKLRPGEILQYILTDTEAKLADDRVRVWTLWEGWHGYDVKKYQEALREAFEAFEHYTATADLFRAFDGLSTLGARMA
jgi:DNA polymerase elongation subunit (family B)